MTVPPGTYGRIAPRSGLALKRNIDIGAGVIDEDYTGPVGVLMINNGSQDFKVNLGDRIAQLILERIVDEPIIITYTGGEGSITQQVHGEFMVSSETIRSHFTQWVHAGYFLKVPTNSPSENPPGKV